MIASGGVSAAKWPAFAVKAYTRSNSAPTDTAPSVTSTRS